MTGRGRAKQGGEEEGGEEGGGREGMSPRQNKIFQGEPRKALEVMQLALICLPQ